MTLPCTCSKTAAAASFGPQHHAHVFFVSCLPVLQGKCTSDPLPDFIAKIGGDDLLDLKPNQCVILSTQAVLPLTEGKSWLDNVYFRHTQGSVGEQASSSGTPPAPLHVHSGEAFITNVTIQGDGISQSAAFWVFPSANILMIGTLLFCVSHHTSCLAQTQW